MPRFWRVADEKLQQTDSKNSKVEKEAECTFPNFVQPTIKALQERRSVYADDSDVVKRTDRNTMDLIIAGVMHYIIPPLNLSGRMTFARREVSPLSFEKFSFTRTKLTMTTYLRIWEWTTRVKWPNRGHWPISGHFLTGYNFEWSSLRGDLVGYF